VPPDVRKGFAFPSSLFPQLLRLCLTLEAAQPQKPKTIYRKGKAFPHSGRQSREKTITDSLD
jgi:hypothetical protein